MRISACIWCDCGARYERLEQQLPIKDVGVFECHVCGAVIERWHGRVVPSFKLIARPEPQRESSAA